MKYLLAILFGLMCISQWYVPASMIAEQEDILRYGTVYRFKTAPVDPTDPFRGKYIILDFDAETYKNATGRAWDRNENVFVVVKEDADGFASISRITDVLPGEDGDYFSATVRYSGEETVELAFPFDRFYLEESKASDAEKVYAESTPDDENGPREIAYAVVRVKDGRAALEDVRINDRSIVDIVRELNARKNDQPAGRN